MKSNFKSYLLIINMQLITIKLQYLENVIKQLTWLIQNLKSETEPLNRAVGNAMLEPKIPN